MSQSESLQWNMEKMTRRTNAPGWFYSGESGNEAGDLSGSSLRSSTAGRESRSNAQKKTGTTRVYEESREVVITASGAFRPLWSERDGGVPSLI